MAGPSRQYSKLPRRWSVRLSQGLWFVLKFVWGTIFFGLIVNIVATWLVTPSKNFNPATLPLEGIIQHLPVTGIIFAGLFVITFLARKGSRLDRALSLFPMISRWIVKIASAF